MPSILKICCFSFILGDFTQIRNGATTPAAVIVAWYDTHTQRCSARTTPDGTPRGSFHPFGTHCLTRPLSPNTTALKSWLMSRLGCTPCTPATIFIAPNAPAQDTKLRTECSARNRAFVLRESNPDFSTFFLSLHFVAGDASLSGFLYWSSFATCNRVSRKMNWIVFFERSFPSFVNFLTSSITIFSPISPP